MRTLRTRKQRRAWAKKLGKTENQLNAETQRFLEGSAQKMRDNPTGAEKLLKERLEEILPKNGLSFLFQHVLAGKIVDFYIPEVRLIIEVDGGYHYFVKGQKAKDKQREGRITRKYRRLIRFDNEEIEQDIVRVSMEILAKCGT